MESRNDDPGCLSGWSCLFSSNRGLHGLNSFFPLCFLRTCGMHHTRVQKVDADNIDYICIYSFTTLCPVADKEDCCCKGCSKPGPKDKRTPDSQTLDYHTAAIQELPTTREPSDPTSQDCAIVPDLRIDRLLWLWRKCESLVAPC
jgi:hypothetical protein